MTTQIEPNPPVVKPKSSRAGWVVVLILLVIAAVGGAAWWTREHGKKLKAETPRPTQSTDQPAETADALRVDVVHPRPGGITRTSTQTGSVHPYEWADLYAKVSGYLQALNVDIGDKVKKDDVLAVIEDPEINEEEQHAAAALAQSKAAVKQAEAKLEVAKSSQLAAEKTVVRDRAEVDRYAATRRYREKELARYRELLRKNAVPQSVVDEEVEHLDSAIASENAAKAAVEKSLADVAEAKAMVIKAQADLAEAQAEVKIAESNLAKAKTFVAYMTIRSPYSGVVTNRYVHPGAFIRSAADGNEKPLLTVARTDKMRIVTYVPDRDVPYTDVGDRAEIKLDALNETIEGKVTRFADSEVAESRTMRTEIDVPNPTGRIREGMFGLATIILEETKASQTVPTACLTGESKGGKSSVFVVRDGKAKKVPVTIGADDGIKVEIISGLTAEDQVIMSKSGVSEGTPVVVNDVTPESSKTASAAH